MNLFLRHHRLRPSLLLYLTTPFHHLLSTAAIQPPPSNPQFHRLLSTGAIQPPPSNPQFNRLLSTGAIQPPPSNPQFHRLLSTAAIQPPPSNPQFDRLLSTAAIQPPPSNPQFTVVDYLIQSCNLSSDKAVRASKYIRHLKSPEKPDSVLRFLRHTGIRESDIRTAMSRDPRFLCSHVEKNWRPNVAKLQEIGLSIEDISGIISRRPHIFSCNFVQKIDFWMLVLGSVENLFRVLKRHPIILLSNLEKVIMPNLCFLRDQLGLSLPQIVRLILSAHQLITSSTETLKIKTKKAEELGVRCSSPMFVYALQTVSNLSQSNIDARLNNLESLGFSQEEVTTLVSTLPTVLKKSEVSLCRKVEFLIKEVGFETLYLVKNPFLLNLSLEKRHIPRNLVRKLLQSKGFPVANQKYSSFVQPTEKLFVAKFVLPYEHAIPGLHRAYSEACSGNVTELNGL